MDLNQDPFCHCYCHLFLQGKKPDFQQHRLQDFSNRLPIPQLHFHSYQADKDTDHFRFHSDMDQVLFLQEQFQ